MRTITQRTTFPFLIAESGAASFTLAVTTSPNPARSPRSPPRGRMQESLRAPELSATSRIVRIPIIWKPQTQESKGRKRYEGRLRRCLGCEAARFSALFYSQLRGSRPPQGCPPHHFCQLPALQLAQRPALDDAHHI